jgi:hypothetical protein
VLFHVGGPGLQAAIPFAAPEGLAAAAQDDHDETMVARNPLHLPSFLCPDLALRDGMPDD